ncbi:MAG: hypothetical protein GF398_12460 [Chitinivibrionales bacterium]|nr:hypothetical protein [Chitinivibrionales bacterium]
MYENPQYLTPDGYRRSKKNPLRTKQEKKLAEKKLAVKKRAVSSSSIHPKSRLSDEAAAKIAAALKIMLKS